MPYWQLYYHLVWSTKDRLPLVTADAAPFVYEFIRAKALSLEGSVFALNGMPDHVHLVAAIPPRLAVADFIGQVKGVSAASYNKLRRPGGPVYWREEYGAFSFDRKRLPHCVACVEGQAQHHAENRLIPALEHTLPPETQGVRERAPSYIALPGDWWRELADAVYGLDE